MCSIPRSKGIDADVPDAINSKKFRRSQTCRNIKINSKNTQKSINEEVEVEEAEVVITPRALGVYQIQDAIEDVGRYPNEASAIVDQMRGQLGVDKAQQFGENVGQALE